MQNIYIILFKIRFKRIYILLGFYFGGYTVKNLIICDNLISHDLEDSS